MPTRRLLIAYAHPDDESFGLGALISRYVAEGVEVYLICATNGEAGTVAPELLNGYSSIAELRLAELDCAAERLKLKRVYKFGYKDSGMMNSAANQDPQSLWQAPVDEVARRVIAVIREVRPHVMITFNRYGGYGHPDHIAIQRAATDAFYAASDPAYITAGLAPHKPQKLYYSSIPSKLLRFSIWYLRWIKRQDPRKLGRNRDIDMTKILDHVEPVHARVKIRDYHAAWDRANDCHQSQLGGGRWPRPLRRWLQAKQSFTRVYPAPPHDKVDEDDLFAGVTVEEATAEAARG